MKTFAFAGLVLFFLGPCSVATVQEKDPDWVTRLIAQYTAEPVANPPRSIWKALYRGQTVYYVPPVCCDQFSQLYDAEGNLLCAPDGGITGKGDGRCNDFAETSTNSRLVWRDTRSRH